MRSTLIALAVALAASQAHAAGVEVSRAWVRPAAAGTTGGGYMTLTNRGAKADALVGVASPVAREVMTHQSMMSGGVSMMHEVARMELKPGASVTFAPGGYHLMLMDLKRALKPGETVPATLTFASGAKVTAAFTVRVDPPPGP